MAKKTKYDVLRGKVSQLLNEINYIEQVDKLIDDEQADKFKKLTERVKKLESVKNMKSKSLTSKTKSKNVKSK